MAQVGCESEAIVVSHGPQCLDGIVSAVVVARSRAPQPTRVEFAAHAEVDQILLSIGLDPVPPALWITDMSWTDPAVDAHLGQLLTRGTQVFWVDHHRTAIHRHTASQRKVRFTGLVLDDSRCAAWLTYTFVLEHARKQGQELPPAFRSLETLVTMTDDHDRWVHRIDGSQALAATVAEMETRTAYDELLRADSAVTYTEKMAAAAARVEPAREQSFALAHRTRKETAASPGGRVVAAICDGYASDIAAAWGEAGDEAVFALYDLRGRTISLRRSPRCAIDLSALAERLGGGGHAAAAGYRWHGSAAPTPEAMLGEIRRAVEESSIR